MIQKAWDGPRSVTGEFQLARFHERDGSDAASYRADPSAMQ